MLAGVVAHEHRNEGDTTTIGCAQIATLIPAQRGHGAAVPYRTDRSTLQQGGVDQPVHARGDDAAHLDGEVVTARDDLVRTQCAHQLFVRRGGIDYDPEPSGARQLHHVAPDSAGGAAHRQRLAGLEGELVEGHSGGQAVHRERGCLRVGRPGGRTHHRFGRDHHPLGVPAVRPERHHDRHDPLAEAEVGGGAGTDLLEGPGRVHARDVGRRHVLQLSGAPAAAQHRVGGVDGGCVHPDGELARTSSRLGHIDHLEDLGPAEPHEADRPHRNISLWVTGLDRLGATARCAPRRRAGFGCMVRLGQRIPPQQLGGGDHLGRVTRHRRCGRGRVLAGSAGRSVRLASRTGGGPVATSGPRRRAARATRGGAMASGPHRPRCRVGLPRHRHRPARVPPDDQRALRGVPPPERAPSLRLDTRRDRLHRGAGTRTAARRL